jgi:hypothetical protein
LAVNRFGKKLFKITGITIGVLFLLLIGFHFWFKAHAKQILEEMVESKSNGKIKLKIEKIHFNYFSRKIKLKKAVFFNTDTLNGTTAYQFSIDKLEMQVKAILPIVFKKEILIDYLTLNNPGIQVTRLRAAVKSGNKIKKDVSIPEEMGKVYSSIQDALQILKVKRFEINDGVFILVNKIDQSQLPLIVSNINFHIDNLAIESGKLTGKEKLLFSENVVLRSSNQNILFPDGRHRLSFSRFRINLKKKLVEFDSCTISAIKGDSATAAFNVFFDALKLTNIDFDTLYKSEVIKADSVYCVNPKFNLDVELGKKKGSKKTPPKLENIIQQLTGDLQLGFVVVSNADFNIKTFRNGVPSSFNFTNNSFEMQGLSVDQEAAKPIKVKSFAMAIRNYENFIKDSTYNVKFDSVLFKDDHITLSNFLFNKLNNGKILNTFTIPRFTLRGLSWDDLVFERKLIAEQAIMYNPQINYTVSAKQNSNQGRQNIFQSLGMLNEFMDLQQLDIVKGTIDLKLKNNLRVQLDNATISVKSQSLLESKKLSGIKNSLTLLAFQNGIIHAGNTDMVLHDIRYVGKNGQFGAGSINVSDKKKNFSIKLQNVSVHKMQVNEESGNIIANGVTWKNGDIKLNSSGAKKDGSSPIIEVNNVMGSNTSISGVFGGKSVSTTLNSVSFSQLVKNGNNTLILDGLEITGQQLKVKDNNLHLSIADYNISDNKNSIFRQIVYKSNTGKPDADIIIPSMTFTPHVQPLLNGEIALDGINMIKPVINLQFAKKPNPEENKRPSLPKIDISELKLIQPEISFIQQNDSGVLSLHWHGEKNSSNFLQANELHIKERNIAVNNLSFYLTDFIFTNPKGKIFNTGDGKVAAKINNIKIEQEDHQPLDWAANITDFDARDFQLDSIGKLKRSLIINSGSLKNLNISSSTITDLQLLAAENPAFQINHLTGFYSTSAINLRWANVSFNRNNNFFKLDSFSMIPVLSRDSFIAHQSYQTDYFTIRTEAVNIGPFDIDRFIRNNSLNIGTASIDHLTFTDYKDKQLPFNAGVIKPLPVNMIKMIPQKLSIDTVLLNNANVEYTEFNNKTMKAGIIPVTRMTVRLLTVKNYNINPLDSLRIQATGYLMDTIWMRLRVKESYIDSLGGFLMTLRVKPADMTVLNAALIPLASIKLESGFLDTLTMRAVGREYLSLGEMQMYYHDLKIRFLKNGEETKKTFINSIISFLANSLIIKKNNKSRTGKVFFIRKRDKSAINYLIKIAMSGMASSAGVKSNRKMLRRYKKELEKRNLPPIDFE